MISNQKKVIDKEMIELVNQNYHHHNADHISG